MAGKYYESLDYLLKPDPVYGDANVAKFINCIMKEGKRSTAQRIFYGALDLLKQRITDREPLDVFRQAVENVKPLVEVRSKRVGGANYQVPVEVSPKQQRNLAYRWILESAREKKGKPLSRTLADELLAAFNREGGAMAKRDNTHKMADSPPAATASPPTRRHRSPSTRTWCAASSTCPTAARWCAACHSVIPMRHIW